MTRGSVPTRRSPITQPARYGSWAISPVTARSVISSVNPSTHPRCSSQIVWGSAAAARAYGHASRIRSSASGRTRCWPIEQSRTPCSLARLGRSFDEPNRLQLREMPTDRRVMQAELLTQRGDRHRSRCIVDKPQHLATGVVGQRTSQRRSQLVAIGLGKRIRAAHHECAITGASPTWNTPTEPREASLNL